MKLLNDFFSIRERTENETGWVYRVSLNANHSIYQAHFKGNPITPGACIVQMVKELAEKHFSTSFFIRQVKNVKFLSVINPLDNPEIEVHFLVETGHALSLHVSDNESPQGKCHSRVGGNRTITMQKQQEDSRLRGNDDGMFSVSAVISRDKTVFCKLNLVLEDTGKAKRPVLQDRMDKLRLCVVIPTYNNEKPLIDTLLAVTKYTHSVIAVNDGSTDNTRLFLSAFNHEIDVVSYPGNKGKGHALKRGFDRAEALGYKAAITMDSDGQHTASDIEAFVRMAETCPDTLLIGQRTIQGTMSAGSSFANKFSNFWFAVQTGRRLQDTQNGFRLYPLSAMKGMRPHTSRYEAELELLVRSAWKGIPIRPVPVQVRYLPEDERISHFRPGKDFLRISLLNTLFTFLAILYGYPSMLFRKLFKKS